MGSEMCIRDRWCGVCVVGQRMPRCCLSQVVYVRAVARVHALRGVVGWVGSSGGSGGVSAAPAGIHWPVECPLGGWSWGSACGSGAHPYTSHAHMGARTWRRRRRARGLLPIPISLVIPLCLCPRRTLRVVFVFWCVVWGWRVACFGGKHLKPVHTCLPRHLGGSLSSRLVRWPAPSPARRRCQTSPEPKGRLLPSHVVPRATRAPIVARAHPALHAHVARMICLSQCLQHDPATRVPTVLAVSRPIEVIACLLYTSPSPRDS